MRLVAGCRQLNLAGCGCCWSHKHASRLFYSPTPFWLHFQKMPFRLAYHSPCHHGGLMPPAVVMQELLALVWEWQYCQQILHGAARVGAVSGDFGGFKV